MSEHVPEMVDAAPPEQTDNGPRPEDGEQDVPQDPSVAIASELDVE